MKTYSTISKSILAILIVSLLSSCYKQEGCTDPSAINYDPWAEVNDGSCYNMPDSDPIVIPGGNNGSDGGGSSTSQPTAVQITMVELENISLCDGNGNYWDGSQWDKPDVQLSLYQTGTSAQYNSPTVHNVQSHTFYNVNLNITNLQQPLTVKIQELDFIDGVVTVLPIATMLTYNFQLANWNTNQSSSTMTVSGSANLCTGNTADMKVRLHFTWIY